jgi:hypothetical protein
MCKKEPKTLFSKLSRTQTNIEFSNTLKETHTYNYFTNPYMYLGAEVGVGDINIDLNEPFEEHFYNLKLSSIDTAF